MSQVAKVVDRRSIPSMKPDRRGQLDVVVTYAVQGDVQYAVVIAEELATPEGIRDAIRKDVEARAVAKGMEVPLD